MKTLIRFVENFLMFLILPIIWYQVESCGQIGASWNTMLRNKYRRSYNGSVSGPLMLWLGLFFNIILFVVMSIMIVRDNHVITFIAVINNFVWLVVLTPIINRSYEAMNWRKAGLFSLSLRTQKLSKYELKERVKKFLVHNLVIAIKNGSNVEFDHLEYVLRVMDLWEGTRTEVLEELNRTEE